LSLHPQEAQNDLGHGFDKVSLSMYFHIDLHALIPANQSIFQNGESNFVECPM
jgi:hypothetical protein